MLSAGSKGMSVCSVLPTAPWPAGCARFISNHSLWTERVASTHKSIAVLNGPAERSRPRETSTKKTSCKNGRLTYSALNMTVTYFPTKPSSFIALSQDLLQAWRILHFLSTQMSNRLSYSPRIPCLTGNHRELARP